MLHCQRPKNHLFILFLPNYAKSAIIIACLLVTIHSAKGALCRHLIRNVHLRQMGHTPASKPASRIIFKRSAISSILPSRNSLSVLSPKCWMPIGAGSTARICASSLRFAIAAYHLPQDFFLPAFCLITHKGMLYFGSMLTQSIFLSVSVIFLSVLSARPVAMPLCRLSAWWMTGYMRLCRSNWQGY